jgi:hypothetical protein
MAQNQVATLAIRAVPLDLRLAYAYIKLTKPQYSPYLATIQAVMNQYIVPYAYFAMIKAQNALDPELLVRYTDSAYAKINEVLRVFGVEFKLGAGEQKDKLVVTFEAVKAGRTAQDEHLFTGEGPDFGPVYEQSLGIAKVRWASYADMLNEESVRGILELANMGYEAFMTDGSPSPRRQIAILKHKLKLMAVDPQLYITRIKEAMDKYELGYQHGVQKYSYIIRWISDGLVAAFKATKTVLQVL